jgi:ribosomal protein S19E (S16A)
MSWAHALAHGRSRGPGIGEAATHNVRYWFERQLAGGYVTKHTGGWLISEKGRLFISQVAAEEKRLEVAAAVAQAKAATP